MTQTTASDSNAPPAAADALAVGRIAEIGDGFIALDIPNTDYRLRLVLPAGADTPPVGAKVRGRIRVTARRIDAVPSGGRYIEPSEGRPRRVQGRVRAIDEVNGVLIVHAGVPVSAQPGDARQNAHDFAVGQMVSFDAEPGAAFVPA